MRNTNFGELKSIVYDCDYDDQYYGERYGYPRIEKESKVNLCNFLCFEAVDIVFDPTPKSYSCPNLQILKVVRPQNISALDFSTMKDL